MLVQTSFPFRLPMHTVRMGQITPASRVKCLMLHWHSPRPPMIVYLLPARLPISNIAPNHQTRHHPCQGAMPDNHDAHLQCFCKICDFEQPEASKQSTHSRTVGDMCKHSVTALKGKHQLYTGQVPDMTPVDLWNWSMVRLLAWKDSAG
jgi:hypothetical protein